MKKTYQYLFGASLALATFSFIGNASAQSCATPPTCESLGYTLTEPDCNGKTVLRCPFDNTKVYCPGLNEVGGNCGMPQIGDYLYSDMTCSSEIDRNKRIIGIIVDPIERKAMALNDEFLGDLIPFEGVCKKLNDSILKTSKSGKENTQFLAQFCNGQCPAVDYALSYKTQGTSAGDWYIPTHYELFKVTGNIKIINEKLAAISAPIISVAKDGDKFSCGINSDGEDSKHFISSYLANGCLDKQPPYFTVLWVYYSGDNNRVVSCFSSQQGSYNPEYVRLFLNF